MDDIAHQFAALQTTLKHLQSSVQDLQTTVQNQKIMIKSPNCKNTGTAAYCKKFGKKDMNAYSHIFSCFWFVPSLQIVSCIALRQI